ncbi:oxidoreductase-like protein [Phlyctema vagabunda]|uniref:Oxidoreductase-like protein n=1 Tax=Phlyctema vagabunda TaxID=108571 RepID=A0ABR4PM65_9HELO
METRQFLRLSQHWRLSSPNRYIRHASSKPAASQRQAIPLGDYYASILSSPTSSVTSTSPSTTSSSDTPSTTSPEPKPAIIFSSRLTSPLERRSQIEKKSTKVAGIMVPPKPEEPDNCCMSGCVNCVWDQYRDEIEEWAAAQKQADIALQNQGHTKRQRKVKDSTSSLLDGGTTAQHTLVSMDDDGGGSESNWETGPGAEVKSEELFANIPVGIREFMKQEKKLKDKHAREASVG